MRRRHYLIAFAAVAAAGAIRMALDPWLGRAGPYLMYYPAVVMAVWYGGFGPGLVATILSGGAAAVRYLNPASTLAITDAGDALSLAIFSINGILISLIGDRARRGDLYQSRIVAIVESSDDAIIAKDLGGMITAWNAGAERLLGYSAAEAIGSSITLIIPEDRWHEEDRLIAAVTSGQRVEPFETIRRRKDGALIDVAVTISPVRTREGAIVGASKIVRDISERRRSERMREELIVRERRARDEAVAAR
ncbi:MAG TPA: PAS domain S-box protein, partial [Vicinamibacterales bacterium]|nr:PAS domain S-box protein [Vicinamibacterales bacterium]